MVERWFSALTTKNLQRSAHRRAKELVAVVVIVLSIVPVYLAQRISSDPTGGLAASED